MNLPLKMFRINYSTSGVSIPSEYTLSDFDKVREYKNVLSWLKISTIRDENLDPIQLSEEFMLEFKNYLYWNELCREQNFSYDFIKNNHNYLNMFKICNKFKFTENQMRELKDYLKWDIISIYQNLSEEFIIEFKDSLNWKNIIINQQISENLIRENLHRISNFKLYSDKIKFTEEFLIEFKDIMNWSFVLKNQLFSENFLYRIYDLLDWYTVSLHQVLSEKFIRDNKNKVYWVGISQNQKLSINFIREFYQLVDWDGIIWKQKLNEEIIDEFQDYIDFEYLGEFQKLSEDFLDRHEDYIYLDKVTARGLPYKNNNVIDYTAQYQLSYSFVEKNKNYVSWEGICAFQDFKEDEWENLIQLKSYFEWRYLFSYQRRAFSKKFLLKYLKNVKLNVKNIALSRYILEQIGNKYNIPNDVIKIIHYCI